ncbi:MAG: hypothetical protein K8R21_15725 [Leptospira sp.]|nr:hypothetical protein [Leptospira sp.]
MVSKDIIDLPALLSIGQVCATLFAGLGLLLTARAFRKRAQQDRQEILFRFWAEFWKAEKPVKLFYEIEYGHFKYTPNFHLSRDEQALDQLLGHFQFLALQYKTRLLRDEDLEAVAYFSRRIFENAEVQKYLNFLQEWAVQNSIKKHPYADAINLNAKIKNLYQL